MKAVTQKQTVAVLALTTLALVSLGQLASADDILFGNPKKVLYEADFSTLDPAFGETSKIIHAEEGKLILEPGPNAHNPALNQGLLFDDMDVTVNVRIAKAGGPVLSSGLVFWAKALNDYYFLSVTSDGRVGLFRLVNNRWVTPMSHRVNSAVKTGANVENQLRVVTAGNRATVYINGTEVGTIQGQPPEGGSFIGVAAEGVAEPSIFEFSHLKVTK